MGNLDGASKEFFQVIREQTVSQSVSELHRVMDVTALLYGAECWTLTNEQRTEQRQLK
jgi:hypothetical protein